MRPCSEQEASEDAAWVWPEEGLRSTGQEVKEGGKGAVFGRSDSAWCARDGYPLVILRISRGRVPGIFLSDLWHGVWLGFTMVQQDSKVCLLGYRIESGQSYKFNPLAVLVQ